MPKSILKERMVKTLTVKILKSMQMIWKLLNRLTQKQVYFLTTVTQKL